MSVATSVRRATMTAAVALSIEPEAAQAEALRERVQVLESRPGVREVLLVTEAPTREPRERHVVVVLGGGGGGFAVVSRDGLPQVYGGLSLEQRQRLADAIGGAVIALSPPSDRPAMDRDWRLSNEHVCDMQRALEWARAEWPCANAWVLGINNGALSAAVATASIDDLAGAVLLACVDEALDQPQKSERMRVLAVRHRHEAGGTRVASGPCPRRTLVSVHDERRIAPPALLGADATQAPRFNGKERQVVDVVARWILTGTAPDEIR